MLKLVAILLSTTMLMRGDCILPEERYGTVEIVATDMTGQPLTDLEVKAFDLLKTGSDIEKSTAGSHTIRLRYGAYRLQAHVKGFASGWRYIEVSQPEQFVRFELELGVLDTCPRPPASIGGTVKRGGVQGELWVKAVPLTGTGDGESHVGGHGYFLISGLKASAYIVMVLQGDRILHQEVTKTFVSPLGKNDLTLSIDLGKTR